MTRPVTAPAVTVSVTDRLRARLRRAAFVKRSVTVALTQDCVVATQRPCYPAPQSKGSIPTADIVNPVRPVPRPVSAARQGGETFAS